MKIFYYLLLSLLFLSCKSQEEDKSASHSHSHNHQHHHQKTSFEEYAKIDGEEVFNNYHNHSNTHQKLTVELINNTKYVTDTNSYKGLYQIKTLLDSFNTSNSLLKNYKDLGYNCKKEAVYILNNSKMEGEGYTVFHDLMHTLVFDIKNLDSSKDIEQAKQNVTYIQEDVNSFFKYFENIDLTTKN